MGGWVRWGAASTPWVRGACGLLLSLCLGGVAQADRVRALRRWHDAEAHYLAARYDDALLDLAAGYREDPDPEFVYNVAKVQQKANQPMLALRAYQRYLELAPDGRFRDKAADRVRLLLDAGADLLPQDATPQAIARARALAHFRRAETYYRQGRYTEAIGELGAGFERDSDPDFLYNIAKTQQKAGMLDRAARTYQSYLALLPRGQYADKARAQLERLRPAQQHGEPSLSRPPSIGLFDRREVPSRPERPVWRLATAATFAGAGLGLVGFGAQALSLNGTCVTPAPAPQLVCDQIYDAGAAGVAMTGLGVTLVLGAAVLFAWPPPRTPPAQAAP